MDQIKRDEHIEGVARLTAALDIPNPLTREGMDVMTEDPEAMAEGLRQGLKRLLSLTYTLAVTSEPPSSAIVAAQRVREAVNSTCDNMHESVMVGIVGGLDEMVDTRSTKTSEESSNEI